MSDNLYNTHLPYEYAEDMQTFIEMRGRFELEGDEDGIARMDGRIQQMKNNFPENFKAFCQLPVVPSASGRLKRLF